MNMTSTAAFCVIANCLSQIKQIPVFLGRRKRDVNYSNVSEAKFESTTTTTSEVNEITTTTTELPIESTTQVIEFNLNGKNERFIVAREVTVEVLPTEEPLEDLDLESEPLINNSSNFLLED